MNHADPERPGPRWILLIHQIPPKPDYLRVKIWRRLQRLGAVAIKNSVYVLPRSEQAYEDFQWVLREIAHRGGEATICEARFVEGLSDEQVEALFGAARDADYAQVSEEARRLTESLPPGPLDEDRRTLVRAQAIRLRRRFSDVTAIDFLGAPGCEVADGLLSRLEAHLRRGTSEAPRTVRVGGKRKEFRGRTWVTRKGIHVDRMASAWLIRRFIDPEARFKFVPGGTYRHHAGEVRFDMYQAEFTHVGDLCTFERLVETFAIADPAVRAIAEIVHDIDLKDAKYGRPETQGIAGVVTGIVLARRDDEARLARAAVLFEDLHEYFGSAQGRAHRDERARPGMEGK